MANDVRRDLGRIGRDVGRIGRCVGRSFMESQEGHNPDLDWRGKSAKPYGLYFLLYVVWLTTRGYPVDTTGAIATIIYSILL